MRRASIPLPVAIVLAILVVASSATAGNGNRKSTSSISLVQLSRTAESAGPRYGDGVTFAVETTATDRPYVLLNCYENGVWVLAGQAGFWPSYPWSQVFTLASSAWTSGAADCTARLGSLNADGSRFRELATTSFHVDA